MFSALLLAASVPDYRATGTEPFWALTIARGEMRLEELGRKRTVARAPVARPSVDGRRYVTRRMTVEITRAECSDGMSDRVYPDTVVVKVSDRKLRGCGGLAFAR